MEIKELKVQIEKESVEYLQEVFKDYKEVNKRLDEIKGRCIIHIYPKQDTYEEDGALYGFCDALLCEMHIYDCEKQLVYKTNNHDSVYLDVPCGTRIFKDLSTMLIIDSGITISYGTGLSVYRLE